MLFTKHQMLPVLSGTLVLYKARERGLLSTVCCFLFAVEAQGRETQFLHNLRLMARNIRRNAVSEFSAHQPTKFLARSMKTLIFMQSYPVPQAPRNHDYTVGCPKTLRSVVSHQLKKVYNYLNISLPEIK
ncbi:hypothetical protein [Microcoleus sp.]|uniref:hypothetical protein n=1 Tax=Microcoleus sp. TaxID=44472 RepID=UPI003592F226